MKIKGTTKVYAVLGHPISHSLSPLMHNAAFKELGMDAVYVAFDVVPERLENVLKAMHCMGFGGVNLTIPLKEKAYALLNNNMDDSARLLGSVNTVEFRQDHMRGYSTDGYGFLMAVKEEFGIGVAGLSFFVIGAGGAGRAVAITIAREGANSIAITDVVHERAEKVAEEIRNISNCKVHVVSQSRDEQIATARTADMIIQATPVGMKPDDKPLLSSEAFRRGQMLFDLVYHHRETGIMEEAKKAGVRVANGLSMLLHQGARSFAIWTGREPPLSVMRSVLEDAVYGSC